MFPLRTSQDALKGIPVKNSRMDRRGFAKLIGAAAAGLGMGAFLAGCSPSATPQSPAEKHACKGMNTCKGQGGCKTGDQGCAGKNTCKGKGGCEVPMKK